MPRLAAAYLMVDGDQACFVENNTTHAVPRLLAALEEQGMPRESVRYAIITHVHLDHAGGSAALLAACPNATLLCHPKAARHVIDPSRLVESSKAVYGPEAFEKLYGSIEPIDARRVQTLVDNASVEFGSRMLRFLHTRGHADHHFVIHDSKSNGVFTGDTFGIAYPDLQSGARRFLFASTTPTQFHPEEAHASVEKILNTGADRAYLTHFGSFDEMADGARMLHESIDAQAEIARQAAESDETAEQLTQFCETRVRNYFQMELEERGLATNERAQKLVDLDASINAMGLALFAERLRRA